MNVPNDSLSVDLSVDIAITSRRSIRGFLPKPVPRAVVEHILRVAARAPSGTNTQPWQVIALSGEPLSRLTTSLVQEAKAYASAPAMEYSYYPDKWLEPFLSRRRKVGFDLYSALGVSKDDMAGRQRQFQENYRFFGAPVGLLVFMHRSMGQGSLIDVGMFIQNILIAARGQGLESCPQAAFSSFSQSIYRELQVSTDLMLLCGIALGHADPDHPANRLRTERVPINEFVDMRGF